MRIDAHQHFWRYDPVRDAWITEEMGVIRRNFLPADLAVLLEASGVDGTVAVQADQSEEETAFLLDLAETHPFILGVVGWLDLRADDLRKRLEHFCQWRTFRGLRHIAQVEPDDFLSRAEVIRGVAALGDFDLTYDILVYPRQLPAALELVRALPEQPFVVDHIAKPSIAEQVLEPWASRMRELSAHPNVWCKVSGMVTEAKWDTWKPDNFRPYLDLVFDAFGPERLMFGSDWPVCLLAGGYRQVLDLVQDYCRHLSAEEEAAVFGSNAIAFYGLDREGE
jgi:L-fuconolactonase